MLRISYKACSFLSLPHESGNSLGWFFKVLKCLIHSPSAPAPPCFCQAALEWLVSSPQQTHLLQADLRWTFQWVSCFPIHTVPFMMDVIPRFASTFEFHCLVRLRGSTFLSKFKYINITGYKYIYIDRYHCIVYKAYTSRAPARRVAEVSRFKKCNAIGSKNKVCL